MPILWRHARRNLCRDRNAGADRISAYPRACSGAGADRHRQAPQHENRQEGQSLYASDQGRDVMRYCTHCLYPETKPDLTFDDEGKCSACLAFEAREAIDWDARAADFKRIITWAKVNSRMRGSAYDCIVPVSGGKDSHHQVLIALENDLKVLAVTAETDHLSEIGRRNLDNIARLGVDHIEVKTNP